MRGEPDLQALYAQLHDKGVRLALPVVVGDDQPLKFVAWTPGETMTKDRFGASVPTASNEELEPQALIIPCLGFLFLPWTTLAWAVAYAPIRGVTGFGWFIVILGFFVDLGSYTSGYRARQARAATV